MSGMAKKNLRIFKELCGDKNLGNVQIVTTDWDLVGQQQGNDREATLANGTFKSLIDAGASLVRHDKGLESALLIMSRLIHKKSVTTQIQEELTASKTLGNTSAGTVIIEEMKVLQKRHEKELESLRKEIEEAVRARDEECRVLEAKMARVEKDQSRLEMTFPEARLRMDGMKRMTDKQEVKHKSTEMEGNLKETLERAEVDAARLHEMTMKL